MNATAGEIMDLLSSVPDPEIPALSVVDLGIVRTVQLTPPEVHITPTYSGCPATLAIESAIRRCLDQHGLKSFSIRTVLSPAWTTEWITSEGHRKLKAYGIAPPDPGKPVECPQCGSTNTEAVSRFGSTPCKAQWRCLECLEPFDHFKCH